MSNSTKLILNVTEHEATNKKIEQLAQDYANADNEITQALTDSVSAINRDIQDLQQDINDDIQAIQLNIDIISKAIEATNTALDIHKNSADHDSRYYTEDEITKILSAYSRTYVGVTQPDTSSKYIIWINTSDQLLYYRTSSSSTSWIPIASRWS